MSKAVMRRGGLLRRAMPWGLVLCAYLGVQHLQQGDALSGRAPALRGSWLESEGGEENREARESQGFGTAALPRSEPTLVYFWASWCGVCGVQRGAIESVAASHRVISIASQSGSVEVLERRSEEEQPAFPVLVDPQGAIAAQWGVRAFPTIFVIDREGEIWDVESGYTSSWGLRLRLWLAAL